MNIADRVSGVASLKRNADIAIRIASINKHVTILIRTIPNFMKKNRDNAVITVQMMIIFSLKKSL